MPPIPRNGAETRKCRRPKLRALRFCRITKTQYASHEVGYVRQTAFRGSRVSSVIVIRIYGVELFRNAAVNRNEKKNDDFRTVSSL